jgi:polyisoprenyl-phosphate glycosyltransferase
VVIRLANPGAVPSGFTTLIVLMLFIGGIQLLFLGVIGSYLAHIYEEVKRRPPFIVESILNRPEPRTADAPRRDAPPWE